MNHIVKGMSRIAYPPLAMPFVIILFVLLIALLPLLLLGIVGFAFAKLGISAFAIMMILFFSFVGSFINIPLTTITSTEPIVCEQKETTFLGMRYIVPEMQEERSTLVAVNLGGAIIPFLLSAYLFFMVNMLYALIGIVAVSLLVYILARPIKGVGIAVPALLPPIVTVIVTYAIIFILDPGSASTSIAAPIAYISGTIGTLIGADLLNIREINKLCAPVVSIGGAGTFDGVFLTGLISVLLV